MATTVDQKLLKSTKFPAEFNQKVDMQKVNLEVMKRFAALPLEILDKANIGVYSGGLQARSPVYSGMRMMWSLSFAST